MLSVAISNDAKYLISGSSNKSITIFDLLTAQQLHQLSDAHDSTTFIFLLIYIRLLGDVSSVAVSSDSNFIVSGSKDKTIKLFNLHTREELHHFAGAEFSMSIICRLLFSFFIEKGVVISDDQKLIISKANNTSVRIFDMQNGRVKTLRDICAGIDSSDFGINVFD